MKETIKIESADLLYITYLLKREAMADYLDHEDRMAIKQLINELNQ
jgi:hypothetical protein